MKAALGVLLLAALCAAGVRAEPKADRVLETGVGPITQSMIDSSAGIYLINDVPDALLPDGMVSLSFFVTESPAGWIVLLAGTAGDGTLWAIASLEYPQEFLYKEIGYYEKGELVFSCQYPYATEVLQTRWSWDGKTAMLSDASRFDALPALNAAMAFLYPSRKRRP